MDSGKKDIITDELNEELDEEVNEELNEEINEELNEEVNEELNKEVNEEVNEAINEVMHEEINNGTLCSGKLENEQVACCHHKATPRSDKELKNLKNRLNRMAGQLNGIGRMLDDNRYCGDILTQVAAVESALQSFGYMILKEHMETCVVEEIQKGNTEIVDEAVELIRKLK